MKGVSRWKETAVAIKGRGKVNGRRVEGSKSEWIACSVVFDHVGTACSDTERDCFEFIETPGCEEKAFISPMLAIPFHSDYCPRNM